MSSPDSQQLSHQPPSDQPVLSVERPVSIPQTTDHWCDEETAITELTFLPDGRLCLFGASRELLEVLGSLNLGDATLEARLAAIRGESNES